MNAYERILMYMNMCVYAPLPIPPFPHSTSTTPAATSNKEEPPCSLSSHNAQINNFLRSNL